jgi:tetratricopeptide (TPR) repeat protein
VTSLSDLARELDVLRCRAARGTRKAKVSLSDLAGRVDLPLSTVHAYVSGKTLAPIEVLDRMVIALDATPVEQSRWSEAWFRVAKYVREQRQPGIAATPVHAGWPVPRQLPMDVPGFTGRLHELAELDRLLTEPDPRDGRPVAVSVIVGSAGTGKTALAVHFGHRVVERFPDGQLYVDLRGFAPSSPMTSAKALGQLLRGLGLPPERVPVEEQEQAATYRSLLAGKRVLVVLDNARAADQVEPLLPGSPGCLVLITSRTTLATVDGAIPLRLGVLSEPDALTLLTRLADADRVRAEPEAATALVGLCARLPLAVRIAGARLAARPGWSVETLVTRFADASRRLDELQLGDRAVRASFTVSRHALEGSKDPVDQAAARAFRLLGALDWVEMSVPVAATLLDLPQEETREALERLVDDHLLDSARPGRYHTHDLLRLYSRDLAKADEPECQAALLRVLDCYLAAAEQATWLLHPTGTTRIPAEPTRCPHGGFALTSPADAGIWVETEHANLVLIAHQAAAAPAIAPKLRRLVAALDSPLDTQGYWPDLVTLHGLAAQTAQRLGDRSSEAFARYDLGWAYGRMGCSDEAVVATRRGLALYREIADRKGEMACLNVLGFVYRLQERFDEALTCKTQALAISMETGDRRGEASSLDGLGLIHQRLLCFDDAVICHHRALAIYQEIGERPGEATALGNLGWAYHRAGNEDQAIEYHQRCLTLAQHLGDRYQEAESLWGLGQTHQARGHHRKARSCWQRSIIILRELGELSDAESDTLLHQPTPPVPAIIQRNI